MSPSQHKHCTLDRIIKRLAKKYSKQTAITCCKKQITYQELHELSQCLAGYMLMQGIKAGDRVAFFLEDSIDEVLLYLACFSISAVAVPIFTKLRSKGIQFVLEDSKPSALFTCSQKIEYLTSIKNKLTHSIAIHTPRYDASHRQHAVKKVCDTTESGPEYHPALITYTSGSTGQPKGIVHSQYNLIHNSLATIKHFQFNATMTTLVANLDYTASFSSLLLSTLMAGGSVIISRANNAEEKLQEILDHKINVLFGPPSFWHALIRAYQKAGKPPHTLKIGIIGTDRASTALFELFFESFGLHLTSGMGMTETLFQSCMEPGSSHRLGSAGKAMPGVQLKIIDEHGNEATPNTTGELLIHSRCMMLGYWNRDDATQKVLIDGWLHSGDLGYLDEGGYFWFIERKKNIIIMHGHNISPGEIEAVLTSHPSVHDAVAVAQRSEEETDKIVAFVTLQPTQRCTEEELIDYAHTQLDPLYAPQKIVVLESMPLNQRGKVDRLALKKRINKH